MKTVAQTYATVPVDNLTPHPDNPRTGNVEVITESVDANGFYGAVLVQKSSSMIVAGAHRWQAAKAAGAAELPVILLDVDDATARRIVLADNRTSDLAGYDSKALTEWLATVADDAGGLAGTGFSDDDFADMRAELEKASFDPSKYADTEPTAEDRAAVAAAAAAEGDDVDPAAKAELARWTKDAERLDATRRLLVIDLPVDRFVWAVDQLRIVCEREGLATNADAVLALIADYTDTPIPRDPTKRGAGG